MPAILYVCVKHKYEPEIELYYDHGMYGSRLNRIVNLNESKLENSIIQIS